MSTIKELIFEKLRQSPDGATTSEITLYCLQNGAIFNADNIEKSVSGQLSRIAPYYKRISNYYIWSLYPLENKYKNYEENEMNMNNIVDDVLINEHNYDKIENIIEQEIIDNVNVLGATGYLNLFYKIICTIQNNDSLPHNILVDAILYDSNNVPISVINGGSDSLFPSLHVGKPVKILPSEILRFEMEEKDMYLSKLVSKFKIVIKNAN